LQLVSSTEAIKRALPCNPVPVIDRGLGAMRHALTAVRVVERVLSLLAHARFGGLVHVDGADALRLEGSMCWEMQGSVHPHRAKSLKGRDLAL
jgi:hypothetical protein